MERIMPILLDVILIVVLVIPIFVGIHNGFVKTVVHFAGYFISILAAFWGSRFLANLISGLFRNSMIDYTTQKIGESVGGDLTAAVIRFQESVPAFLQSWMSGMGSPEQIAQSMNITVQDVAANVATGITDTVILPLIAVLLQIILFLILLTLFSFLVKYIAKAMGVFNKIPVIGTLNGAAGGLFGLLEGILFVFILISVGGMVLSLISGGQDMMNKTILFRLVSDWNPLKMR